MPYFLTAINTDSGKTWVSALIAKHLNYAYWKPIQAGMPRDSKQVRQWTDNSVPIQTEAWYLKYPESPNIAARKEGKTLDMHQLPPLKTQNTCIEGAGGCLVPLNDRAYMIDIAKHTKAQIILVIDIYLGCINHALLTCAYLQTQDISVRGVVFNKVKQASFDKDIIRTISQKIPYKVLFTLPFEPNGLDVKTFKQALKYVKGV